MVHKQDALSNSHETQVSESTLPGTEVAQPGDQTTEYRSEFPPEVNYNYQDPYTTNQPPSFGIGGTFDAGKLLKAHSEYRRKQTTFLKSGKNYDELLAYGLAKDDLIEAMDEALQILGVL